MSQTVVASVIMTVYNGESFLSAAIESIKRQTMPDFEFVIVDDGSTDNTPSILTNTQNDPRVKVITSKRLGRARALNIAWRNTKGEFIANLDADDLAEPDRIQKQVNFLQANPGVGLVGTAWKLFVGNNYQHVRVFHPPLTSEELRSALIRRYPFSHSSTMFTRRVLEQVNENYQVCIDYEITTRIACQCEVANLSEVLVWKRSVPTSFFSHIGVWERYKAVVSIRWMAWLAFSRRINELPNVVNGWGILKQALGGRIHRFKSSIIHPKSTAE